MKITEIRTHKLAIPTKGRYNWALGAPAGANSVLVEVHTDSGIVGYGDALGSRSAVAAEAAVHSVAEILAGEDPFRSEYLLGQMYWRGAWTNHRRFANQAFAGIEMALWDICGKAVGQPASNLLGGRVHDSVHWFAFLQGDSPQALAADARRYVDRGFDVMYLKIGIDQERDLAAAAAVREAVGYGPRLRLDPNEAWDRLTALHMINKLAAYEIDWVEQPLAFSDLAGTAALKRQVSVPIALDQALFTDADVLQAIRLEACDVVVLGFHETGGLLPLRKAAAVAAAGGLTVNRHGCLGETGISTMAALQVLSTIPNLSDGHQLMHELFVDDVLVEGLVSCEGGRTDVPARPGLGLELNWDNIERFERLFEEVGQYSM